MATYNICCGSQCKQAFFYDTHEFVWVVIWKAIYRTISSIVVLLFEVQVCSPSVRMNSFWRADTFYKGEENLLLNEI